MDLEEAVSILKVLDRMSARLDALEKKVNATEKQEKAMPDESPDEMVKVEPGVRPQVPPEHMEVACYLRDRILEVRQQKITEKTLREWCRCIRLMIQRDGRSLSDIRLIIQECHDMEPRGASGFTWRSNILSMQKLRERWNEGKIYIGMNNEKPRPNGNGRTEVSQAEIERQMRRDINE